MGVSPTRLRHGCPLSANLFKFFKEIISRHSQGLERIQFGNLKISADDVLLASKSQDLQHVLGQCAAQCEAARMTTSTSKSEVKGALPSLGCWRDQQCEMDRWIGAVMRLIYCTVERQSSRFIGQSTHLLSPNVMKFG